MTDTNTTETPKLIDAVTALTGMEIARQLDRLEKGFDERAAFEKAAKPANTSIQEKLTGYRKKLVEPGIAAVTLAANVDPNFMNTSGGTGSARFNVYAIDKVADLLLGLTTGHLKNAANRCVVQSLFRCMDAGVPFTNIAAQAAVSQNMKVEKALADILVRHTVSPATAPTPASSTMNALQVIGAVKNTGSPKHPVWQLTASPVTERLREVA